MAKEITSKFEGKKAPAFSLINQNGELISLKDLVVKGKVLIFFYPKDMTPGCTTESIGFSDLKTKLRSQNVQVVGVSKDSVERHQKFIDKQNLTIDLLSDEDAKMLEKYGVWIEKSMFGKKYMGISRETFLIGEDGKVIKHWQKVKPASHPQEVLDFVKAYGE